jgi:hypothetical protein
MILNVNVPVSSSGETCNPVIARSESGVKARRFRSLFTYIYKMCQQNFCINNFTKKKILFEIE